MLAHLSITNLAIIDGLEVSFGQGLNVLSGETGAGKSIILSAVGLLMGGRAQAESVRDGADEAVVEGLFELGRAGELAEVLARHGIAVEDGQLILRRVVSAAGRSRAYVNGRLVNLSVLAEIGSRMLSISGQHESQRLLKEAEHVLLLDGYAGLEGMRAEVASAHARLAEIEAELNRLKAQEADRESRVELLTFQLDELDRAELVAGEDEELAAEANRLRHAQALAQGAESIHQALYAADGSAVEVIGRARSELSRLVGLDAGLAPLLERLEEAGYLLEDVGRELSDYARSVIFDPARQAEVEERLALIRRLIRKYAPESGLAGVLDRAETMAEELAALQTADQRLAGLEADRAEAEAELKARAAELTGRRREAAARLKAAVESELAGLSLEGARFEAAVEERDGPIGPDGADVVTFYLSTNPGEPLRPLAKVASGGELSRVTLALKSILARESEVETVIFDEVDAGIGGRVAEVVGRKLRALSERHQVLCITHLPQIAAWGQTHLKVVKETLAGRTASRIEPLTADGRVAEIARMLAGVQLTDKALAHAKEMLAAAD